MATNRCLEGTRPTGMAAGTRPTRLATSTSTGMAGWKPGWIQLRNSLFSYFQFPE